MRHKQSIIVVTIGLFVVMFIIVLTGNGDQVTPRSTSFHFQHIGIAEQLVKSEEPIVEESVEEQVEQSPEQEIVEQQVIEAPLLPASEPSEDKLIEAMSEPIVATVQPQEISKARIEPLNNDAPVIAQTETLALIEDSADMFDFDQMSISYKQQLSAWLEKYKRYPAIAKRRAYQGLVVVRFSINNQGNLLNHEITQASKHRSLNNAVIKMLENATPMPAMPKELQTAEGYYEYEIPVRFELSDS